MRRRSVTSTMLALLATLVLSATALGEAFDNGSFENGTFNDAAPCSNKAGFSPTTGQGYMIVGDSYCPAGTISGWTVTAGNVDWISEKYWDAPDGDKSLDLVGRAPGTISQDLDTIAGKTYFVTFQLAGNPNSASVKKVLVTAPGFSQEYEFNTSGKTRTNMGWAQKDFTFVATGASSALSFKATGYNTNDGPALDAVTVTQIVVSGEDCKKDGWRTATDKLGNAFKNQGDCVSYYATGEKNLADPRD
jgi:choice-of-anchor C domain-containing protein